MSPWIFVLPVDVDGDDDDDKENNDMERMTCKSKF